MKKLLILAFSLLFAFSLFFSLTACGEDAPIIDDPSVDSPTEDVPTVDEPTVDEPTADGPEIPDEDPEKPQDSPTTDAPTEDAPNDDPTVDEPTTDEPTADEPTTDGPTADEPTDKPTDDNPTVDDPTIDEPTDKPTEDKPEIDEPAEDEPTVDEPTTDEPTTDEPTVDNPTNDENAYSEGLKYTLSNNGTYYILSGIGTCKDTKIIIPSVYNGIPVTTIGGVAFWNCASITSVIIGDSVTKICEAAFENCTSLTSIVIPNSVTEIDTRAFEDCTSLTSVVIGDRVTIIGSGAFGNCTSLTSVIIGNSVTEIGSGAFGDCTSLTSVIIPDNVTAIGNSAFYECTGLTSVVIGNSVTEIGTRAFAGCDKLVEVINKSTLNITVGASDNGHVAYHAKEVHSGESKIANQNGYLFYTYDGVNYLLGYAGTDTKLTLPNSYNGEEYEIYYRAFFQCTKLTSVAIGDSITKIGSYAFYECTGLTSVVIGDSVTTIGSEAFFNCRKLVEVINESSLKLKAGSSYNNGYVSAYAIEVHSGDSKIVNYNDYLFYSYKGVNYLFGYVGTDTELTLPESYNGENYKIFEDAFRVCTSLTSVVIPNSVTEIGSWAFYYCTSLTSVVIPDSVTEIGSEAFRHCYALTSVVIGDSVTSIGDRAFEYCDNFKYNEYDNAYYLGNEVNPYLVLVKAKDASITNVTIHESTRVISSSAFYYCTSLTSIEIPDSVTEIGNRAFKECYGLTSVEIGDSVSSIGEDSFFACYNLIEVINRSSLNIIDGSSYYGHVADYAIEVHNGESKIVNQNGYLFYTCYGVNYLGRYVGTDTELFLPESYNGESYEIYNDAFAYHHSLTSVVIPDSVTEIGSEAFYYCTSLTSVVIGDSVTEIGPSAFYYCTSLTSIKIPDSVTSINREAFYKCSSLTNIKYRGTEEQWNKIFISDYSDNGGNSALYNATKHFEDADDPEIKEDHLHDFEVNGGWVCRCGHIQDVAFTAYKANLQSDVSQPTYYDSALTKIYGTVYVSDEITVIGSADDAYLIKYSLDAGGYKFAFIAKKYIVKKTDGVLSCNHSEIKKEHSSTVYTNLVKKAEGHSGYTIYNRVCSSCGFVFDCVKISFESEKHTINAKGYCDCGYIDNTGYSTWETKNDSNKSVKVYQTPESSAKYGAINAGEDVLVLGESCGRYLIEYKLDDGSGVKQGYVNAVALNDTQPKYSIYVDSEYFVDSSKYMVVGKDTYYQIYFKNNRTGEIVKYGTDGFICKSSNEAIVEVGPTGTMVIKNEGLVVVKLLDADAVIDTVDVIGCVYNSRITNYSVTDGSQFFKDGFAPNGRLSVFNYKSVFIKDESEAGGGYFKVTFDVYNDVPTIFSVGVFNKDGEIIKQKLVEGYSAGMVESMVSGILHIGDLFNGKLISGKSSAYQKVTSMDLKVPLGGYVDFLTLANSDYMIYANVLSGIVIASLETADAWIDVFGKDSPDLDVDEMKFSEKLIELLQDRSPIELSVSDIINSILAILDSDETKAAIAAGVMGFIGDNGVTMADLFEILADCCKSNFKQGILDMLDNATDKALLNVPPAKLIKEITDAVVNTLQYGIVLKDISVMANNQHDYLIIVYPVEPIE